MPPNEPCQPPAQNEVNMRCTRVLAAVCLFAPVVTTLRAEEQLKEISTQVMWPGYLSRTHERKITDKTPGAAGCVDLVACADEVIPYHNCYRGIRVFVANRANEQIRVYGNGGLLNMLYQQARDEQGQWRC